MERKKEVQTLVRRRHQSTGDTPVEQIMEMTRAAQERMKQRDYYGRSHATVDREMTALVAQGQESDGHKQISDEQCHIVFLCLFLSFFVSFSFKLFVLFVFLFLRSLVTTFELLATNLLPH